ncbi:DUF6808 domain-containing protein [Parabacteroides sp. AM08-6]|uniref:DUF6808 domain-containing protein n=1 Tax=Parabacteroides sp. AM08-6 TaxID=2292053 RepID=UPI000EFF07BC|nr:hypothetical protein [Parabacteroides sp. AM08-6]RHJ83011.1 hypothetical protein DW103_08720 [Parabacteroides sp. AM08-6]
MKAWHVLLVLILCASCFFAGRYSKSTDIKLVETTDTLIKPIPEPSYIVDIGEVEIPYPVVIYRNGDTVREHDTIYIPIPITRKVYETGDYRAVISGFMPNLDTMAIYQKKEIIYQKNRRWGLGITVGYGIGRNGLSPYLGVGAYYRIW